jgi:hypothetical protein
MRGESEASKGSRFAASGQQAASLLGGLYDIFAFDRADVAELVDAHGSGPCGRKSVEVQVLSSAFRQG